MGANRRKGMGAENAVAEALKRKGYNILARNYHTRFGELDIAAEYGGFLVIVEVKYRKSAVFGTPAEAVTPKKQLRLIKTAAVFAAEKGLENAPTRFDVAEVFPGGKMNIIEDAFNLDNFLEESL